MPTITITFEHQQAEVPKYTFGDHLLVIANCAPQDWLIGEVVGMTLETEIYSPRWWYSLKLNSPLGYEEYAQDELVPTTQIAVLQAEWEQTEANWVQEDDQKLLPKFQPGTRVRLNAESGFNNLLKDFAVVVSSNYVTGKYWSGWTYKLTNKDLTKPIEIGEVWLELAPSTTHLLAVEQLSLNK